jgi:hypothetical protein
MTLPALLFGILISSLYGAAFHLFRGGGAGRLILYIILAWIGFWVGQLIASQIGISLINIGPLHLGIATLSSWLFLGIGHWLSLVEIKDKQSKA